MKYQNEKIEDSLLVACEEFLKVASLTGNEENTLSIRFSAIKDLWLIRFKESTDPHFPNIKDFIPEEQWKETTKIFKSQQIRFVGALSSYLIRERNLGVS